MDTFKEEGERFAASYRAEAGGWQVIAPLSSWDGLADAGGDDDADRVWPDEASCAVAASRMTEKVAARAERLTVEVADL